MKKESEYLLNKLIKKYDEYKEKNNSVENDEDFKRVRPSNFCYTDYKYQALSIPFILSYSFYLFSLNEPLGLMISLISSIVILCFMVINSVLRIRSDRIDLNVLFGLPLLYLIFNIFIIENNIITKPEFLDSFEFTNLFYFKAVSIYFLVTSIISILLTFITKLTMSEENKKIIENNSNEEIKAGKLHDEYKLFFSEALKDNDVMQELLTNKKYKKMIKENEFLIELRVKEIEEERVDEQKRKRLLSAFIPLEDLKKENKEDLEIDITNE